jgi:hypothetical protein
METPMIRTPRLHRRPLGLALGAALAITVGVGCGSDGDEASAEEQFCAAGEDLQSELSSLASFDVVQGGTDGLTASIEAIQGDLSDMRESGSEVASDEIATLEEAIDTLKSDVESLGGEISVSNATAVVSAVTAVGAAAVGVIDGLSSTCD